MHSTHWHPSPPAHLSLANKGLLQTRGLLTLTLTAQCGTPLTVHILFEGFATALAEEASAINNNTTQGWARIVLLSCGHKPMLYARSFIPLKDETTQQHFLLDQHPFSPLRTLGNHPLGLWLVQNPQLQRSPFRFTETVSDNWPHCPKNENTYMARQSDFSAAQQQLILTEIFL